MITTQLTKTETVALWHAVQAYERMASVMHEVPSITQGQIDVEMARLKVAKCALRKVNKLRKQGL